MLSSSLRESIHGAGIRPGLAGAAYLLRWSGRRVARPV